MTAYEEGVNLNNHDYEFIDSAYTWDLSEGLDRITMLYGFAFDEALASQRALEIVFFSICLGALFISYLFLFRINLIKNEITKTALMRALLPSGAFQIGKDAWAAVGLMNVKSIDDMHANFIDLLNQVREAVGCMKPHKAVGCMKPHVSVTPPCLCVFLCVDTVSLCVFCMKPRKEILDAYAAFVSSMRQFFEAEEKLMEKYEAPHRKAHCSDHRRWTEFYMAPLVALREDRPEALNMVTEALGDTRLAGEHNPKMDIPLGRFLNRRGVY
ncbi:hypothetical protein PAPYR_10696 [Paratrimastix pyriformis]|uniref:Uncharacterized protein n=1 Tax=Paratrimastix pyriformis TaxID=342808 RepID=A0ABQ8U958_9EUKA|nr:hypothetical protein PAPYR_10696 [Paratrimastix pyriformis]